MPAVLAIHRNAMAVCCGQPSAPCPATAVIDQAFEPGVLLLTARREHLD
jgi:hypothetical protein